jgi:hypothetical protein
MEKIMSETNDTPDRTTQDRELRDDELDAVSGGLVVYSIVAVLIDLLRPAIP